MADASRRGQRRVLGRAHCATALVVRTSRQTCVDEVEVDRDRLEQEAVRLLGKNQPERALEKNT